MESPTSISLKKNDNDSTGPTERSNADGVTNRDPVQILVQELDALSRHDQIPTIFHVPISLESIKKVVIPRKVSIGPYHHGEKSLRPMEKYKQRYLRDLLARKPEIGFDVYLGEMRAMEKQTRQFYDDAIEMSTDDFALMLLLDGCFILEYSLKRANHEVDYLTGFDCHSIGLDLLLLENQIPYSVIHKLGTIYFGTTDHNCRIRNLLCKSMMFAYSLHVPQIPCRAIHHLLHLYYLRITPRQIEISNPPPSLERSNPSVLFAYSRRLISWILSRFGLQATTTGELYHSIPSATKLCEAGITFKRKNNPRHLFDITFENGTIEMPFTTIARGGEILFANVLFYEQVNFGKIYMTMTSYLILMGFLIDTRDDVAILVRSGILQNYLSNDEEVAVYFSNIFNYAHVLMDRSYRYNKLMKEVQNYINTPWNRNRAILARDYFSNPWSVLSLFAAITLLLLTVTQTGFTIYPFVHPK